MIEVCDIAKAYRVRGESLAVLRGTSATIEAGAFAAICGASGCGKSTLLLILGGLLQPDCGEVTVAGEALYALSPERRALTRAQVMGYVFQRFHLIPYLTVEENIRAAAIALSRSDDPARVEELMQHFQIENRRHHLPGELSVGEQQRTALARSLYNRPKVLLADEPTGNLDPENEEIVLKAFDEFTEAGGTVVMVTHHPDAAQRADKRWWIRDGMLVEEQN
ncbi:MAG: ABC transporter ATP-binding protein [Verrucomicrobia bacterium]|jgi:putative ABC transport system ATP-binding protein|nr:ABC transporter ATP-binding protein [Verrucomicrobiota bacterium]